MLFLTNETNTNQAYLMLRPTSNSRELLKDAVSDGLVTDDHIGAHLGIIENYTAEPMEELEQVLQRVGSRFGSFDSTITEIAKVSYDGKFLAVAAVIDSSKARQIFDAVAVAMSDADINFQPVDDIALHIAISTKDNASAEDLIGETLSFDQFVIVGGGDEITMSIDDAKRKVDPFYISSNSDRCDGYAVLRTKDDGLVCCHNDKTTAQSALSDMLTEERSKSGERLVRM